MGGRLSAIRSVAPQLLTGAELVVDTTGEGFTDVTREAACFVEQSGAGDGVLLLYLRHTSASLVIQENADPDVRIDLVKALRLLAPADGPWVHSAEGPDDMPSHIKSMLTEVSFGIPVMGGRMVLGTWQGVYLIEHRDAPHERTIALSFIGKSAEA